MNIDQIAAEAWDEIIRTQLPVSRTKAIRIIKSAIEKATTEINDLWERASRQADTLAEYLVDAKAEISVLQSRAAQAGKAAKRHHYQAEEGFPCPCGKSIDDPIHIQRNDHGFAQPTHWSDDTPILPTTNKGDKPK